MFRLLAGGAARVWAPSRTAFVRPLSMTSRVFHETTASPPEPAAESKNERVPVQSEADRAALWNQMLNTIIVDPADGYLGGASPHRRTTPGGGVGASPRKPDGTKDMRAMIEQLDQEFRERPTYGLATPGTPTTGRSVSVANSYNGTSATLYRQLSQLLARNHVRRELKLVERYEKPNQMRRRKRSERHRRRFADMIRKKVQLVRRGPLTLDYGAQGAQCVGLLVVGHVAFIAGAGVVGEQFFWPRCRPWRSYEPARCLPLGGVRLRALCMSAVAVHARSATRVRGPPCGAGIHCRKIQPQPCGSAWRSWWLARRPLVPSHTLYFSRTLARRSTALVRYVCTSNSVDPPSLRPPVAEASVSPCIDLIHDELYPHARWPRAPEARHDRSDLGRCSKCARLALSCRLGRSVWYACQALRAARRWPRS